MKAVKYFFSSLNLFDYILGGLIIVVLLVTFVFLRRWSTFINITFKVTNSDVLNQYARPNNEYLLAFVEGDVERNELGQIVARIEKVEPVYESKDKLVAYVTLNTKVLFSPLKQQYSLKGKPIAFGQAYTFTLSNVKFEGIVVDYPGYHTSENLIEESLIVRAVLRYESREFSDTYGVPIYIAEGVKEGDEITNSAGKPLVRVLKVESKPAKRTVLTSNGGITVVVDPLLKDVSYELELSVKRSKNYIMFQNYSIIEIGSTLSLPFKNITIYPTISQILE